MNKIEQAMDKLEKVFEKTLKKTKENQQKYWRKTLFPKNHRKNYKDLLDN